MKKRFLSLVLVLVLLCSFAVTSFAFSDVASTHWAKQYINLASASKIVNGYEDGTFNPEKKLKAGEFIKMVACVMDKDYVARSNQNEHWAYQYVKILKDKLEGFDDSIYNEAWELEKVISRGEMSIILAQAYSTRYGVKIRYDLRDGILDAFYDVKNIPDEQKPYINLCVIYGMLNGYDDGEFKAQEALTRAQACKVICKLLYR